VNVGRSFGSGFARSGTASQAGLRRDNMVRKSGFRFSEKLMLDQKAGATIESI
jgi:hypothetical protein